MVSTLSTLPHEYQQAGDRIAFPYLYGTPVARRTADQLETITSWREGLPESRRRHMAMWIWCHEVHGVLYGLGQMSRSRERALANWQANPSQFSHPDSSYHVNDPARGLPPVAVDNVGTGAGGQPPDRWNLIHSVCGRFGLRTVSGATERHHTQLVELPGSKRDYNANPSRYHIGQWTTFPPLPGQPPPEEEDLTPEQAAQLAHIEQTVNGLWKGQTDTHTTLWDGQGSIIGRLDNIQTRLAVLEAKVEEVEPPKG